MFLMWMDSIALPASYFLCQCCAMGLWGGGHTGSVQGPNAHTATLIAIDFLDKHVFGGCLDGDTFVAVGNFYVVDVTVR